jgi:Peptidoglycan-binding protein, CsiV
MNFRVHARLELSMKLALALALALCSTILPVSAQQPATPAPRVQGPAAGVPVPAQGNAAAAPPARPTGPLYNVELIVFRATSALGSPEDWALEAGAAGVTPPPDGEGEAAPPPPEASIPQGPFVRLLDRSEFQLNDLEARLRASAAYSPVAHVGWSQTATAWGSHVNIPMQRIGIDTQGISGSVALERGQFLHLALMLNYAMPNPPAALGAAAGTVFTLNENHRVRFYERNYFDHPAFGVIALVTPAGGRRAGR